MTQEQNRLFHEQALNLLHNQLVDCTYINNDQNKQIDKSILLDMFNNTCRIIQNYESDTEEYKLAEAVFYSCIRSVRCLCIEDKESSKLLLQDKIYTIDALSQYTNALRNYKLLREHGTVS